MSCGLKIRSSMMIMRTLNKLFSRARFVGVRRSSARSCGTRDPNTSEKAVCSWNEWDPLEEVIVGRVDGMRVPNLEPCIKSKVPPPIWSWIKANAGKSYDPERIRIVSEQVEEFCRVLELEGVTVRRPEVIRWDQIGTFKLPFFTEGGLATICPRDGLMVVGDEIIESSVAWRSRYFESCAYKKLFTEYFQRGANWVSAPKPTIGDELFDKEYPYDDIERRSKMAGEGKFVLTENEIAFDAADALRFGKDIFITYSHNTNRNGIDWLRRYMKKHSIEVHSVTTTCPYQCHLDATIMPLRPGILVVNPDEPLFKVDGRPGGWDYFSKRGWKVVEIPHPVVCKDDLFVSKWIHTNMLSLDEERIVMQKGEVPLKKLLISLGMKPIEVDMSQAFGLGGAFHCWTLDVKRTGELKSYF